MLIAISTNSYSYMLIAISTNSYYYMSIAISTNSLKLSYVFSKGPVNFAMIIIVYVYNYYYYHYYHFLGARGALRGGDRRVLPGEPLSIYKLMTYMVYICICIHIYVYIYICFVNVPPIFSEDVFLVLCSMHPVSFTGFQTRSAQTFSFCRSAAIYHNYDIIMA